MEEIWKDVEGFEGYYQVSNYGRIKRLPRISAHSVPGYFKPYGERIAEHHLRNKKKYIAAKFCINNVVYSRLLHRVVLGAFIPCPGESYTVNHKDGNKHNNRLDNLEWVTQKENNQHAIKSGLVHYARGEDNGQVKTNEKDVIAIKKMLKNGVKQRDIAKTFGVSPKMVTDINTGRTWKHIKLEE